MGKLVSEAQINLYKGFVTAIREDLGRDVTLYLPGTKKNCFNCLWDPINKRSTGIYSPQVNSVPAGESVQSFSGGICPKCNGTGQFTTQTTKLVKCLIRSLKAGTAKYQMQGIELENDFRLKAPISALPDFEKAKLVVIDSSPTEVSTIIQRGLRDLVQIVVFCKNSKWNLGEMPNNKDVSKF